MYGIKCRIKNKESRIKKRIKNQESEEILAKMRENDRSISKIYYIKLTIVNLI